MEVPALMPDTLRARHAERLARSMQVFDARGTRRRRLRCPLSALRSWIVSRRRTSADLFGPPLPR